MRRTAPLPVLPVEAFAGRRPGRTIEDPGRCSDPGGGHPYARGRTMPARRTYYIGLLYRETKKEIGENQYSSDRVGNNCPSKPTAEIIGEQFGVAPRTVKNAEKFADAGATQQQIADATGIPQRTISDRLLRLADFPALEKPLNAESSKEPQSEPSLPSQPHRRETILSPGEAVRTPEECVGRANRERQCLKTKCS